MLKKNTDNNNIYSLDYYLQLLSSLNNHNYKGIKYIDISTALLDQIITSFRILPSCYSLEPERSSYGVTPHTPNIFSFISPDNMAPATQPNYDKYVPEGKNVT